jgi:chemotaxis signal transduction protein
MHVEHIAAWLLEFDGKHAAAVGLREVLHVAYHPQLIPVPQTPPHCSRVIVVEDRIVPAWDVAAWLGVAVPTRNTPLAAVIGYQARSSAPTQLGALLIASPPVRIEVSDEDACALPLRPARWHAIAISCVRIGERVVPILDLRRMFSDALSARRMSAVAEKDAFAEVC